MFRALICALAFMTSSVTFAQTSGLSCSTLEGNLHIMGDKCLASTSAAQADTCFANIEKGIADGYKKQCGPTIEKFKSDYSAKEKAKFPPPAAAAAAANTSGLSCQTLEGNLHIMGDKCLASNTGAQAETCFADVNKGIADGYKKLCMPTIEKFNTDYSAKVKAKFPAPAATNNGANTSGLSCQTLEGNLHIMGDKCLASSTSTQADTCFAATEKGIADGYKKLCMPTIEKFKADYSAKQKAKFSAATAGKGTSTTTSAPKPADCNKLIADTKAAAMKCLASSNQLSRKKCFDAVGDSIQATPGKDACQSALDGLKSEIQNQEHSKYPTQPSALN